MGFIDHYLASRRPPDYLYHYTSQRGLIGIVQNKSMWATNIRYLNDLMEFKHALELIRNELKSCKIKPKQKRRGLLVEREYVYPSNVPIYTDEEIDFAEETLEELETATPTFFVCSFSEEGDLLSQWRGYCSNNSGFCLGFESSQLAASAQVQGFSLAACIYEREQQKELIQLCIREAFDELFDLNGSLEKAREKLPEKRAKLRDRLTEIAPMLKDPSFSEEREWRIIAGRETAGHKPIEFREGKSMIIPYMNFDLTNTHNHLPLKRVIIGPTLYGELSRASTKDFLSSNKVEEVEAILSSIPYREV